jgi:hypothetical protein
MKQQALCVEGFVERVIAQRDGVVSSDDLTKVTPLLDRLACATLYDSVRVVA